VPITYEELERMIEGHRQSPFPPVCLACGYDLTGSPTGRCSECGQVFIKGEWKKEIARLKRAGDELREANTWARRALVIAIVGAVMAGLRVPLRGVCMGELLAVLGGLCGATAVLLGTAVFRADRLPAWAAEYGPAPQRDLAVGCIAIGAVAVAAAVMF
jgi:hypothetical protein